jgi:DNA-binding MarR family transcriptional regulator
MRGLTPRVLQAEEVDEVAEPANVHMRAHRQLTRTFWRIHRAVRTHLEPWGITSRQYTLLSHVNEEGVALTDLASHMNADLSTANGIVNRLEKAEYVERERCSCDRRVVRVKLTGKGRKLRDSVAPELEAQIGSWYAALSKEELKLLCELLARLSHTVS